MKKKHIVFPICFLFMVCNVESLFCSQKFNGYCMPKELIEIIEQVGMAKIVDFYDRPGMINPSYVYGILPGPEENSAVFWCQNKKDTSKYELILINRSKFISPWKSEVIFETNNYPGGLSIVTNISIPLSKFRYVDNLEKNGPKDIFTSNNVLINAYDGVRTLFYCYDGQWMMKMED